MPPQIKASPEVTKIMEVEAWLMEGAYNRVLEAQDALSTSPYTAIFLQRLTDTVRLVGGGGKVGRAGSWGGGLILCMV